MRGFASQGASLFDVAPVAGETRKVCGVECVWLSAINGAGYFGETVGEDALHVAAIPARGGWFVTLRSARLTFTAYVADLCDASVSS